MVARKQRYVIGIEMVEDRVKICRVCLGLRQANVRVMFIYSKMPPIPPSGGRIGFTRHFCIPCVVGDNTKLPMRIRLEKKLYFAARKWFASKIVWDEKEVMDRG